MRKLVLILLGFFAVVTFIRAFDNSSRANSGELRAAGAGELPPGLESTDFKAASMPGPRF